MNEPTLKICPCGKIPEMLYISDAGQGGKWAEATHCGDWVTEFRTSYTALDSDECMEYAIQAWNDLDRGAIDSLQATITEQAKRIEVLHSASSTNRDNYRLQAEVDRYREALVKCKQAAFSDPFDERDLDVHWLQNAILIITNLALEPTTESKE